MERSDYVKAWICLESAVNSILEAVALLGDKPTNKELLAARRDMALSIAEDEGFDPAFTDLIAKEFTSIGKRIEVDREAV